MIFLYILIILLGITALLLFTQIRIKIKFEEEFSFKLYIGFLKIPLKQNKEKIEESKTLKNKKKKSLKANAKKPNKYYERIKEKGLAESLTALIEFIKPITKILNDFSSHIKINPFVIKIVLVGDDAAQLAVNYGKLCSVIYPAINILNIKTNMKNVNTDISVDYTAKEFSAFFEAQLKFRIFYSVKHTICFIIEFLKLKSQFDKKGNK